MRRATTLRIGQSREATPTTVFALITGAVERARIQHGLRSLHNTRFFDSIADLERQLSFDASRCSAMIIEGHDSLGNPACDLVAFVRRIHPHIAIVGYCRAGMAHSNDILALAVAGVHELLFHGIDDESVMLRAVLAIAQQLNVGDVVARELMAMLPERLWPFVRYVTSHPAESQRVSHVADALGYHRKTLVNHCTSANAPPPQELIAWCRLAVVGHMLGNTRETIESIALRMDFPSDTALRNLVKRYVGLRASEVRALGGLPSVLRALEAALAKRRSFRSAG